MKISFTIFAAGALACIVSGQDGQKPLEFDAASVKPSEHAEPERGVGPRGGTSLYSFSGCTGGPGTTDPGRYSCTNINLRHLIEDAWSLKTYQLSGPYTLDTATFDIEAKVPAGTTQDQMKQMVQKLLIDRFHLVVHHEKREQKVYVLSIGKDGHRLQVPPPDDTESARDALNKNPDGDGKSKSNLVDGLPPEEAAIRDALRSQSEARKAAAGRATRVGAPPPQPIYGQTVNGAARVAGRRATMADLTRYLSRAFNCPVVDHTGLTGEWNFMVEYTSEGGRGSPMAAAMAATAARQTPSASTEPSTPTGGQSIFTAFQKQLGLKLESGREPDDVLVVDKVDKTPTAN
jgi:uncharacterized protein (TIGR03435 family)